MAAVQEQVLDDLPEFHVTDAGLQSLSQALERVHATAQLRLMPDTDRAGAQASDDRGAADDPLPHDEHEAPAERRTLAARGLGAAAASDVAPQASRTPRQREHTLADAADPSRRRRTRRASTSGADEHRDRDVSDGSGASAVAALPRTTRGFAAVSPTAPAHASGDIAEARSSDTPTLPPSAGLSPAHFAHMGDLFLTDEEARAVADSHNRAHGISHNADNPSAPHFAQLIEAGAKITLDTDPEILHQALTLVALNHRDPARALPNIIRADLPDDQVAHLIGIACTEAASLRSNAVFALQGDLTSISQSIQPISPDELGRAHAMIGRISDRIVLDQRALADFRSRMPGELYERIAIATRIDPTIAAARALESATTEYLMWQWQRIQASQQAPSIATASLVESQATDRPQARRPFPAQLGERKRLDQEQRHAQELVRTLILRLQRSQHEVRDADVPRRQRQAALRGAALQQLRLNDAEWGDISGSEEMWLIHRTLVNRFGTTEGYDYEAVDSAAQARLGVSVDELIAASIKRTLGLHGDVGAIMTVLNDFTLNGLGYTPATAHPRDTGMRHQARMLAGGARRRMFEMMPRSEAVRLEQARLQPRRLGAQPPAVNLVSLHQRTLQQAQQRRSEVLGGASETPRRVAVAARRVRPSLGSNPGDTGGVNGGRPASRSAAASETRTANEALGQDDDPDGWIK